MPVTFDVIFQPNRWVARANVNGIDLTLEGVDFPLHSLELVTVTDLDLYSWE